MSLPLTYSIEEAAERLGGAFTVEWLRGHMKEIPHLKLGRGTGQGGRIAFTEAHLVDIIAGREVQTATQAATSSVVTRRKRAS